MKKFLYLFLIAALLFFSACSKKPESAASVEVIDGIEYVHNTETPMYPNKTVSFEEDLSIGGEDEDGNIILFRPMRFIVDQNENIYITDFQDQIIKVFDQNGKYKLTIGRKGEGPGEFMSISYQAFLPDGRFLVMDTRGNRINFFDSSGTFLETFKWQKRIGRLYLAKNSSLFLFEYTFEGDNPLKGRKLFVKEYDFKGNEIQSLGEFVPQEMKIHAEQNMAFGISVPHSPSSIFTADQTGQCLYHCLNNKYQIEVYDKTGKVFRKIDRPYKPLPFTSKDAQEYRVRYENSRNEAMKKMAKQMPLPNIKVITPRMLTDDLGNLWVETHEKKEEEGLSLTAYDIFNRDGNYETKVWLDKRPSLFLKGKMYRFKADEDTGFRFLKRYRVIWSES